MVEENDYPVLEDSMPYDYEDGGVNEETDYPEVVHDPPMDDYPNDAPADDYPVYPPQQEVEPIVVKEYRYVFVPGAPGDKGPKGRDGYDGADG